LNANHGHVRNSQLDVSFIGTHSLRRTKATLIYRRTGNLRAVQLLSGHKKIESMCAISALRSMTLSPLAEQLDV